MNKKILAAVLLIPLILVAGTFSFFFIRMGTKDAKALADFPIVYQNYHQAITEFSNAVFASNLDEAPNLDDLVYEANEARVELNTEASIRISSLTRNDGELMKVALEIAVIAGKELDILREYQRSAANHSDDLELLAAQFRELTSQRMADFARYQELAGVVR